jgi:hypothetical protein
VLAVVDLADTTPGVARPRSKNLQDRKGWIEGWEPRIKADEFIHGLGIGEAYLRHNGRPVKVKLIRADINPPADFDLTEDLPRFETVSQLRCDFGYKGAGASSRANGHRDCRVKVRFFS